MTTYQLPVEECGPSVVAVAAGHASEATDLAIAAFHALGEQAGATLLIVDSFFAPDTQRYCFRCIWERDSKREKRELWLHINDVLGRPTCWVADQIKLDRPPEFLDRYGD